MNKEDYEKDLRERQEKHLKSVRTGFGIWKPCLHDSCSRCHGTGVDQLGRMCIHGIACNCPKCSPYC